MQQSANSIGAVISTRIGQNESSVDYECSIIDTNRAYDNDGEDLFGVGYFILEVAVQQMVYVKSDAEVDPRTVASIVEAGFGRSQGGRVEFRSLLTDLPVFGTVVDVGVLDDALSDPQLPPTTKPTPTPPNTASPSPSILPTGIEALLPSLSPSLQPANSPMKQPSSPTTNIDPTAPAKPHSKTSVPSIPPASLKPTNPISLPKPVYYASEEDEALKDSDFDRQPLIIAAIASGIATILVSCFFIFCIWYPFCWQKGDDREAPEEAPRHRRRRSDSSHSSESNSAAEAMIPGVLHLDEDSRSLANTTVTQSTAKPAPSIYSKPNTKGWKMQNRSFEPVSILNSFDENSVYTSTLGSNASTCLDQAQDGNTSTMQTTIAVHDMTVDATEDGGASISDSATDPFDIDAQTEPTVAKHLSDTVSDPFQLPYPGTEEEKVAEQSNSDSDSDPFEMEENDDKVYEASHTNIGAYSERFDPYAADGDSSIGMTSLAISDSSFGPPTNESVGKISISSVSAKTKQIDNLDAGVKTLNPCNDDVGWSEPQPTLNSDSEEEVYATSVVADSSATLPSSSVASTANNNLLRNILEDARLLARKQNSSSRSAASGKSAPSRLNWKNVQQEAAPKRTTTDLQTPPLLHDLITDNTELKGHEDPARSTSHSVDGIGCSPTQGSPEQLTKFAHRTKYLDTNSILSDTEKLSDRIEFQGRPSGDTTNDPALLAPSTFDLSSSRERTTLGARPMEQPWSIGYDDDNDDEELLVTPPSTPGMLGTTKQVKPSHWLFEAEAPLGARPRSLSPSRSSAWSAASTKSFEIDATNHHGIYRQYPSDPHVTLGGGSSSVGIHLGEQKTASDEMSKSSLDNDLRRLERRLVKTIQSADDYMGSIEGAGSSLITVDGETRRVIVVAPPGKLGVTLADHHDGQGIIVAEVGPHSSMKGKLAPGDKLIAIDDDDVSNMVVNQITSMMASRASKERRLTLLTKTVVDLRTELQETKQDGTP